MKCLSPPPPGVLPRYLGKQSLGPFSDRPFPRFVHEQNPQTECHGKEKIFHRHARRVHRVLERLDVEKEAGNDQSKEYGGKKIQVLRGLVEGGRLLEDTQTTCPDSHQSEPLPDAKGPVSFFFLVPPSLPTKATYMTTRLMKKIEDISLTTWSTYSCERFSGRLPYRNQNALNGTPLLCAYQNDMAKDVTDSTIPRNP